MPCANRPTEGANTGAFASPEYVCTSGICLCVSDSPYPRNASLVPFAGFTSNSAINPFPPPVYPDTAWIVTGNFAGNSLALMIGLSKAIAPVAKHPGFETRFDPAIASRCPASISANPYTQPGATRWAVEASITRTASLVISDTASFAAPSGRQRITASALFNASARAFASFRKAGSIDTNSRSLRPFNRVRI